MRCVVLLLFLAACGDDDAIEDSGPRPDIPGVDTNGPMTDSGADATSADAITADARDLDVGGSDAGPVSSHCAPLPPSDGPEIRVTPAEADDLPQIVRDASPGSVILLEDGTYRIGPDGEGNRRINFRQPGVTLRSASNNAEAVILDGEYRTNEMLFVSASDITIAHITVTHAIDHGVHASAPSEGGIVSGLRLYGVRFIDHGEQFVKVNPNGERTGYVDDSRLECSYFELTDEGRPNIEPGTNGCYTGGIDAHSARGWVVRRNRFEGIYCTNGGLAEHAIHFWSASRDTLVENNIVVDCARGVGFGLVEEGRSRPWDDDPYPGVGYIGHYDGIIRGNSIVASIPFFDTGIELDQARGARVYHNTVVTSDAATGFFSSIDYRFANTDVDIRNNIVGRITNRNGAAGRVENNLEGAGYDLFVGAASGDTHLLPSATDAIDQGVVVEEAGVDHDGDTRDEGMPDLGADEYR